MFYDMQALKVRQELKDSVAANRGDPSQLVHEKLAQYPVGVRVAAGKIPTIKRAVRRLKRGKAPPEPDSLRNILHRDCDQLSS